MPDSFWRAFVLLAGAALIAGLFSGCSTDASSDDEPSDSEPADARVLVFSKTEGFRHASIEDGLRMLRDFGDAHSLAITATEDAGAFTAGNLAGYDAVVFLNTTGDVLDASQQAAFRDYIEGGGGFVGVHAATDTEYDWSWYNGLVGAYFDGHPSVQEAQLTVEDRSHPSTEMLPRSWTRTDEWYSFRSVSDSINVLVTIDEDSYNLEGAPAMGTHPLAWYHRVGDGRSWYTALGHTREAYGDDDFRDHVLGGLHWAAGLSEIQSGS